VPKPIVVATGISHLLCVVRAHRGEHAPDLDYQLHGCAFQHEDFWPPFDIIDGTLVFNQSLEPKLFGSIEQDTCAFIVTSLFGNRWPAYAILNSPRLFDLFLPGSPEPTDQQMRDVIPLDLIEAMAREDSQHFLQFAKALRDRTDLPIYEILEPPPVSFPGPFTAPAGAALAYRDEVAKVGFVPERLRYKMWRAFQRVTIELCEQLSFGFIDIPQGVVGPEGCLKSEYCSGDTIHANERYGSLVLQQIGALLHSRQAGEQR